jgi:hypothetical protein
MPLPVHLQRSTVAAIVDCPVRAQFIGSRSLEPVALQSICLFQESLSVMVSANAAFELAGNGNLAAELPDPAAATV